MNTKKWLTLGLSVALAGCLGWAVAACAPTEPNNPNEGDKPTTPHDHTFTGWDHSDTEHWRVCPDDGEIDVTTRAPHVFTNGTCECGMKEADITPDEGRDTRSFWVVGSGAGDLSKCSFTELKSNFKLTQQPKKDENGYTVYTTSVLTLYAGDTMKIVQDLDWDDGLGYFGVTDIKNNNDGSFVDGGTGNISPAKGKDGKYIFTVRTKKDIAFSACTLEFKLVEPVEPLKNTEEIYIVGNLKYYKTQWPKNGSAAGCLKLNYDEASGEWSIVLRLGGKGAAQYGGTIDEFKLYNSVSKKYYPDGTGNNWTVSGTADGQNHKASGDYKISWKTGDTDVTFTLLPHEHNFDDNRMARDDDGHFTACWLDDAEKEGTREKHKFDDDADATCDKCGYTRHIHKYDQWGKNETQHWKQCAADGTIDNSTRENHTFDQPDNKCVCGQEQGAEACKHEGRFNFNYTTENAPEIVEASGTLHGTCAECGKEVDVSYDVGVPTFAQLSSSFTPVAPTVLEVGKKYYGASPKVGSAFYGAFIGLKVPEGAGTLVLKLSTVVEGSTEANNPANVCMLALDTHEEYLTSGVVDKAIKNMSLFENEVWFFVKENKYKTADEESAWRSRLTSDCIQSADINTNVTNGEGRKPMTSVSISFSAEDNDRYFYCSLETQTGTLVLIETEFIPAAADVSVAPQEVAMLPDGKH